MAVENIARYQIIGELGKGAMGVVYKATDPNIGRTVALKTLRLDLEGVEAQEMAARFKNEARAAGVLNHPNIVTIYDAGEHSGIFYIAMEFIEGSTLQQLLKRHHRLAADRAIDVVRQVCTGLDFAHSKGIIHRDIKPANIMLDPFGMVKIMDFGIAKSGGSGMTSTGQVLGTPNYMSPEQVKGQPLDGRSDLFSLGVVMYEVLTGERPFSGENVTTIIYKIVNEQPAPPHARDASMHPGLSTVVMKALAKAPAERHQSGAELVQELLACSSQAPLTPADASSTVRLSDVVPTATMPTPPPLLATPSVAAAAAEPAAAAQPATIPPVQSTVTGPPRPPMPGPVARKSGSTTAIAIVVIALAMAAGGYFGVRSMRSRAKPAPATQPQATPEATKPEAQATAATEPAQPASTEVAHGAAPQTGDLRVTSSPAGVAVKIDGHTDPDWITPFTVPKLKPGMHTVAFDKDGYKPETRKVEVAAGKKATASADLQALQGFLAINSTPPGADVYVDGKSTGQVTPAKIPVNPGQHRVALRKPGYQPVIAFAGAGAGQTVELTPVLRAQAGGAGAQIIGEQQGGANPFRKLKRWLGANPQDKGSLELRTRPRGAEIWVNDTLVPVKTPVKVPMPPGKYRIALRLPGYKPIVRNVEIEKGKSYGIQEIFEKQ